MSLKFTKTIMDDVKKSAKDTRQQMDMAYEVKKRDIEENIIPKSAMDKLTPEEVERAEKVGVYIGVGVIILFLCGIAFLLMKWGGIV